MPYELGMKQRCAGLKSDSLALRTTRIDVLGKSKCRQRLTLIVEIERCQSGGIRNYRSVAFLKTSAHDWPNMAMVDQIGALVLQWLF